MNCLKVAAAAGLAKIIAVFMEPFKVVVLPFGNDWNGLGNRLKGMGNFFARGYRRYFMVWSDNNWVTEAFSTMFLLEGCRVVEVNSADRLYTFCKAIFRRYLPEGVVSSQYPFWSFILPPHLREDSMKRRWPFCDEPSYSVDWWFERTPESVKDYFADFWRALRPSPEVYDRIRGGFAEDISEYVCVQVRNTGNPDDAKDVCRIETIITEMERRPEETKFFVSYMDNRVWDLMNSRFGARVVRLANKNPASMIDAVADMWLLGHGKELIASPDSTFSEVAWWWGGCKCPVTMLNTEFNQREMKVCP